MGKVFSDAEKQAKPPPVRTKFRGGVGQLPSKMKVTVCFGPVRVIVPCPNREMLVRDLTHEATLRYRKAIGKSADSWVVVRKLQTEADGGILDPDDRLVEVADDREQILAIFEEEQEGIPSLQHIPGDGTSASSVGTSSPDIFTGNESKFGGFGRTEIEITSEELNGQGGVGSSGGTGVNLQVRRGSEPALNRLSPIQIPSMDTSKRWSAAPIVDQPTVTSPTQRLSTSTRDDTINGSEGSVNSSSRENSVIFNYGSHKGHLPINTGPMTPPTTLSIRREPLSNQNLNTSAHDSYSIYPVSNQSITSHNSFLVNHQNTFLPSPSATAVQMLQHGSNNIPMPNTLNPLSRFSRESNRHSMQFAMDTKWAEAADRALFLSTRKDPVGAATSPAAPTISPPPYASTPVYKQAERDVEVFAEEEVTEVRLKYKEGPLGIHLIPEHRGLVIQGVEPGGRIDRDGRLEAEDKIIEINGQSLLGMPFQQAQELFKEGLKLQEISLKVAKKNPRARFRSHSQCSHVQQLLAKFNGDLEEKENLIQSRERVVAGDSKIATVRKSSPGPVQKSLPLMRQSTSSLISANTRKIGRKYEIELRKGNAGLGFSITTRDNPAGGNCPIYIKNVLPTGAAIDDGRLRPGDRLLEVNGIEITGKSQSEAVMILRNVPQDGIVSLLVSRQERVDLSPKLPRQIPPEKVGEDDVPTVPWSEREVLVLDIPVLDTEKAGLGISVKGNAQKGNLVDNGIYIKCVIHGGAASRDGRLKPNDQLLSVNDVSLLNRSNVDAMETLRRTLTQDGPKPNPGFITLKIARRIPTSSAPTTDISACGSSASGDEVDSWGSRNVSFSADGSRGTEDPANDGFQGDGRTCFVSHLHNPNNNQLPAVTCRDPHVRPATDQEIGRSIGPTTYSDHSHKSFPPQPLSFNFHQTNLPTNPVVERLTGKGNGGAVRSESYYRATNEPRGYQVQKSPVPYTSVPFPESIPIQNRRAEYVLLESEYSTPSKPPRNSTSLSTTDNRPIDSSRIDNQFVVEVSTPQRHDHVQSQVLPADVTYASQTSLEDDAGGFARDAFGRQSMSEKRHAALDAKGTDTYQRNKKLRDERERQRQGRQMEGVQRVGSTESLVESLKVHRSPPKKVIQNRRERRGKSDIGPALGMKKSSSLESLQTMVQEIQLQEDVKSGIGPLRSGPAPVKVIRGRGCNESFRQAVDRSYEAPLGDYENDMETLAEEENESGAVNRVGNQTSHSEYSDIYSKIKLEGKKKAGLFRGLGSMFRFGRHRKSIHGPLSVNELRKQQAEIERVGREDLQQAELDKRKARQVAQDENMRIQEQYRRLLERDREERAQQQPSGITVSIGRKSPAYGTLSSPRNSFKPNHPFRKSMDCHSRPASRSLERDIASDVNGNPNTPSHLRSASYDLYNEFTRPGSRLGIVDPNKYSHYINYDEIRLHLNRRHQQHYHSQRRENPREVRQERPVSNFYEYESVQAAIQQQNRQIRNQQPIYVVRNQNGNNGVTLPSPTTLPFHPSAAMLRQRSPSQFQAPQRPPFYATRQMQFTNYNQLHDQTGSVQNQNSLPRPSQNVSGPGSSHSPSGFYHHSQRQQQQFGLPTRYAMTDLKQPAQIPHRIQEAQPVNSQQSCTTYPPPPFRQQSNAGSATTTLGSKV